MPDLTKPWRAAISGHYFLNSGRLAEDLAWDDGRNGSEGWGMSVETAINALAEAMIEYEITMANGAQKRSVEYHKKAFELRGKLFPQMVSTP